MEDYRLEQSGQEVQDILNGAAMQSDLTAETERATEAEQTLQGNIDAEATRAQDAEGTLQDNIDAEEARAKAAEKQNADDIDTIEEKIPSGASTSNKLATEEYVADAVATATATFRGTYNLVSDLHLNITATEQQIAAALAGAISTADNNDYCFIQVPTSSETPTEIKEIDRYKFNGTAWAFEYKLNNSGFTAAQWAAINSGITSGDVAKLAALPTNAQLTTLLAGLQSDIDGEETRAKAAELALQGNIDAEEARAKAAEKQNADDIDAIEAVIPESASSENKVATKSEIDSLSAAIEAILLLIPSAATSLNKLADKAYVNSSIATATATFRGTYNLVNDLGLTTSATHAQIATALAGAILTADNNDYAFVQIPTSDAMPTEIAKTERYKFNGTAWEYEYDLNNSGFTADQWAAINSGITQVLVTKLSDLPTNTQLTTELGTLTSSITAINQKIPNAASQANKLVDIAAMESYIVQVLDVLTISYNVTSTDGHVTLSIEQVDGKITSVALTTSDIASAAALNLKASQADLTALASRVTTAEGNITSLGGRMTTAEGNITSLGGRMTTAEGNITSLGGRVSTNETDIANLQQLYNDLQQSKPEPVTALPSTGQQQGVIYRLAGTTSYSDYMWNGSTWVLMATYNNAIDPRPKKASQNLVTSGGVFDNMGALDVSELNATENPHTLAQYVDLSAALAAIPTDYQKGGMSIKFVQSSDNKYVQYRLMSDSFNATVANWQGVDDEPATGSNNLVKSGGAEKAIQEVKGYDVVNYTWNSINESIAVANLVLIGSVSVGDKVNLRIKAASSLNQTSLEVGLITKTNAQLGANSLDFGNQDMSIERSGTITVATASQEAYIVCWMTGGNENIDVDIKRIFNYTGNETIATLDKRVSDNEPIIENHQEILDDVTISKESKNRFDSEWSEPGKNINYDTGLDQDGTTQRRTGFVAVKSETNYTLSCVLVDAPSVIVFYYDENKEHLSTETTAYGWYPKTITTPANCKFIRITHGSGGMPTDYQIEEGNEATSYEPYQPDSYKVPKSAIDGSVFDIENKKWLFLGDSITAMTGATSWVNKFKSLVKSNEQSFNQAVGGAKWCDDEQGITYNGKPYESQNYIGNQVAWVQRVGITAVDLDAIIIAAGTNDDNVIFPSDSDIESAFYASGSSTLIALENVDRSTWQGAIRWTVQTLRELFPNAKIFLVTPLQRMSIDQGQSRGDMYPVIKQKRETIIKMAKRMSVYLIDTSECNISDMQSGMYEDGLHLSVAGSTVMSEFVYNSIKKWF